MSTYRGSGDGRSRDTGDCWSHFNLQYFLPLLRWVRSIKWQGIFHSICNLNREKTSLAKHHLWNRIACNTAYMLLTGLTANNTSTYLLPCTTSIDQSTVNHETMHLPIGAESRAPVGLDIWCHQEPPVQAPILHCICSSTKQLITYFGKNHLLK